MKHREKELQALFYLLEDPDKEVFETVAKKLLSYGKDILPDLEAVWLNTKDTDTQDRIENLIHQYHFNELQIQFSEWAKEEKPSLLEGALLLIQYRFPDLDTEYIISEIGQIKKNVWLELNHQMSPLEQINIINSIFYSYYNFFGDSNNNYKSEDLFFINLLLARKEGNAYSLGILYLIICEIIDIPIFAVDLPNLFILGYFDSLYHFFSPQTKPVQSVQFYIDPVNGLIYTNNDIEKFLSQIDIVDKEQATTPLSTKEIILKTLQSLFETYQIHQKEDKAKDILVLQDILIHNL